MSIWIVDLSGQPFRPMTLEPPDPGWNEWRTLTFQDSLRHTWTKPKMRFYKFGEAGFANDNELTRTDTDSPSMPGLVWGLSRRAAGRLGEVLLPYGEFLPVDCDEGEFVVYHCMNQLDGALDVDRSEGGRSRDGRLLSLKKPVFRPEVVRGQDVFRVPAPNPYSIFVSDAVVELANRSDLHGLQFSPTWQDSDSR